MNEIPASNDQEEQSNNSNDLEGETPPSPSPQHINPPSTYLPSNYPPQYTARQTKDRNIALVLEILPGLFGLYGFGWIYSGNTVVGISILIGGLVWAFIVIIAAMLTATAACFCTVPVNIIAVALSAFMLNNYTKQHPELFGL